MLLRIYSFNIIQINIKIKPRYKEFIYKKIIICQKLIPYRVNYKYIY